VAGHHALIGAAAGCAINHHREKQKQSKAQGKQGQADDQSATATR
jgi:hypothetical protein